mmetsp:Transcript_128290/g.256231  ORF Transcript_128290/g.256231 Transcript_128290/m.256231 type:complete len:128 (+) Transcript_128290:358-741(+)
MMCFGGLEDVQDTLNAPRQVRIASSRDSRADSGGPAAPASKPLEQTSGDAEEARAPLPLCGGLTVVHAGDGPIPRIDDDRPPPAAVPEPYRSAATAAAAATDVLPLPPPLPERWPRALLGALSKAML